MAAPNFDWDENKNHENIQKHSISFEKAQLVFKDPKRIVAVDLKHSTQNETRYYCFGKIEEDIVTVRFTWRQEKIRIFGAGYWRKGRKEYEEKN